MSSIKKLLGKRIKELRRSRNLTQEQLSELIGIETGSLSAIESGRHFPSMPTIEKISSVLNYEIVKFFDYNHLKNTEEKISYIKGKIDTLSPEIINLIYILTEK